MKRHLEICCADAESVIAANKGGADRIELCSALSEGGVTPSAGLIKFAISNSSIPVNILIRPRSGDFVYTEHEVEIMLTDIDTASRLGASGVVVGALTPEGDIDIPTAKRLIQAAKNAGLTVTFHRAFDLCRNPIEAMWQIIDLGCDRLLTSGQAPTAVEGKNLLSQLVNESSDKIIIMPGAGISPQNAEQLLAETQATEIHASASMTIGSSMKFRNNNVSMGNTDIDEYARKTSSRDTIEQLSKIVNKSK